MTFPFRFACAAAVTSLTACAMHAPPVSPTPLGYDVVITGGRVVDGTGNPWFYGDVGIRGDRIAAIVSAGALATAPAALRINARGRVVARDSSISRHNRTTRTCPATAA